MKMQAWTRSSDAKFGTQAIAKYLAELPPVSLTVDSTGWCSLTNSRLYRGSLAIKRNSKAQTSKVHQETMESPRPFFKPDKHLSHEQVCFTNRFVPGCFTCRWQEPITARCNQLQGQKQTSVCLTGPQFRSSLGFANVPRPIRGAPAETILLCE